MTLTNRPLNPGELFEVYVDRQVDKWAGSLEIGVTTHKPETLEFPSTMTNLTSGTWIMSGGGLVVNGSTMMEDYGNSLDDLKVRVVITLCCYGNLCCHSNKLLNFKFTNMRNFVIFSFM